MRGTAPALLVCLACVVGCDKPRIDASSEHTVKASLAEVRTSLPEAKRKAFDGAIQIVLLDKLSLRGAVLEDGQPAVAETDEEIWASVHGKTGDQVIAAAAELRLQRERKEKTRALAELRGLEQRKSAAQRAAQELKRFEVIRSSFYRRDGTFGAGEPVIEVTVRNGTARRVYRVYLQGTLASAGRAVPWLRESFYYSIPGGLEPGEQVTWELAPSGFSTWGRVQAPQDAVLTVEAVRLDGPNDEKLLSSMEFTHDDEKRLSELRAEVRAQGMPERD